MSLYVNNLVFFALIDVELGNLCLYTLQFYSRLMTVAWFCLKPGFH